MRGKKAISHTTYTLRAGSWSAPLRNKVLLLLMDSAYDWGNLFEPMLVFLLLLLFHDHSVWITISHYPSGPGSFPHLNLLRKHHKNFLHNLIWIWFTCCAIEAHLRCLEVLLHIHFPLSNPFHSVTLSWGNTLQANYYLSRFTSHSYHHYIASASSKFLFLLYFLGQSNLLIFLNQKQGRPQQLHSFHSFLKINNT